MVKNFITLIQRQGDVKIKFVRTDQGKEFLNATSAHHFESLGIVHQTGPRYVHELNGVAERSNCTIKEMISAMVNAASLGHHFWDYAARYASNILMMATISGDGRQAWTMYSGRDVKFESVKGFGKLVFAMIPEELRAKANFEAPQAELARVLGNSFNTSGLIVRFERTGKVVVCRDIRSADMSLLTALELPLATAKQAVPTSTPVVLKPISSGAYTVGSDTSSQSNQLFLNRPK